MKINTLAPEAHFHRATVGGLVDRFMAEELAKDRRFLTQSVYRSYLDRHIRPRWGETLLEKVRPVPVADWLASLELAPKTKSHLRNLFHLLFQWACRWELTERTRLNLSDSAIGD